MPAVDLQAISIAPTKAAVKVGSQVTVKAYLKNNGPDPIPAGEATAIVTVSSRFLNKPYGFKAIGGGWKLQGIKKETGSYNLFLVSTADIQKDAPKLEGFSFYVKGGRPGVGDITMATSLSGDATSGDVDGANQSASTQIIVNPK